MKKYSGFTLLEILLYVVIGGITLVIVAFSFVQITRLTTAFRVNNELNQTGENIIRQIQYNINNNMNDNKGSIVSPIVGGGTSSSLKIQNNTSFVQYNITQNNTDIIYSQSNQNDIKLNPTNIQVLASSLSFEQINNQDQNSQNGIIQAVKVKFTLIYAKPTLSGNEYDAQKAFETVIPIEQAKQTSFTPILNDNPIIPAGESPNNNYGLAYSLRKLSGVNNSSNKFSDGYNGPAIRVRRDRGTDQSEMDIGFTSKGDLNQVALQNFVGYQNFLNYSEDITTAGGWSFPNLTTISESSLSSLLATNLYGERFNGYYNDNPTFFNTAVKHGDTNLTSQINNFSSNTDSYSWQWVGYFLPPTTGSYTFFTSSDDASHLWLGANAITGYTTANALVNNGGLHGTQERSGSINLTAGQYYPIRIMFGENGGGDIMTVAFSGPGIAKTTNGTGYYFGGRYNAPDGTNTHEKVNLSVGNNNKSITKNTTVTSGSTYTDSYYVQANNGYSFVQIAPDIGFSTTAFQNYNISDGTLGSSSGISTGQANIQSVGNGWYRISLTATANATISGGMVLSIVNSSSSSRLESINIGTATDSLFVWGAMRHLGSTLKPYQQTGADANTGYGYVTIWYDQSGNNNNAIQTNTSAQPQIIDGVNGIVLQNNKPSLQFDGNDELVSGNTFSSTSPRTFWVGKRSGYTQSFLARLTSYATLTLGSDLFTSYYLNGSTTAATSSSDNISNLNLYYASGNAVSSSQFIIGRGAGSYTNLNGYCSEILHYNNNPNSDSVQINIKNYYGL
jgi:type II secretory pathway pseudopilin PulG